MSKNPFNNVETSIAPDYHLATTEQGVEVFDFTENEENRQRLEAPYNTKRLVASMIMIGMALLILVARVTHIQFTQYANYKGLAETNRQRAKVIKAPRGVIYTRDGKQLVTNVPSFDIVAIVADMPKNNEEQRRILEIIAQETGGDIAQYEKEIKPENMWYPILLEENVPREQALVLESKKHELPGIEVLVSSQRQYENASLFAHILGYNGKITTEEIKQHDDYLLTDSIGKTGIEKIYEQSLRGNDGAERYEVDAKNNITRFLGTEAPESGDNLVLTIDNTTQEKLHEIVTNHLKEKGLSKAVALALDPNTGGVLAMVNVPSFDNNVFTCRKSNEEYKALINDSNTPLLNRAISGEYSPGSTFKMVVATGALQERLVSKQTTYTSTGGLQVDKWFFPDWKEGGHGRVNVIDALAVSANTYFYIIGGGYEEVVGLGINKIVEYAERYGFGHPLGIDLPGERSGFLPTKEWKERVRGERWYIGNTYQASIGQGDILVTPIQLASYVAAIANNGTLFQPHLLLATEHNGVREPNPPTMITEHVADSDVIDVIREGMYQATQVGSARALSELPITIGGKTGTAQVGGDQKPHAWFVSFAPYDNPEIVLVLLVENGEGGDTTTVPIALDFYRWYTEQQRQ